MSSDRNRLRKYMRKQNQARGKPSWAWITMLKWHYWRKVHGNHINLWEDRK